jgi:hypothetical protein
MRLVLALILDELVVDLFALPFLLLVVLVLTILCFGVVQKDRIQLLVDQKKKQREEEYKNYCRVLAGGCRIISSHERCYSVGDAEQEAGKKYASMLEDTE